MVGVSIVTQVAPWRVIYEIRPEIRSDAKVPYEDNERIMKVCADHGANSLIYAAFEE